MLRVGDMYWAWPVQRAEMERLVHLTPPTTLDTRCTQAPVGGSEHLHLTYSVKDLRLFQEYTHVHMA